jgi:AbiV family abortive infection protein
MKSHRRRRKYRNSLGYVERAFRACLLNASDLVAASKALIGEGLNAPALALSVLALEELGKLLAIDGLLFARSDDHKAMTFHKSGKSHKCEASCFEGVSLICLQRLDSRFSVRW